MKRVLLTLVLVVVTFFVGRAIYHALAGDTTRIGWLLAAECAAFNDGDVWNVTPGFAADYRDVTATIDLQTLRAGVMWAWRSRRDAQGRIAWRVALPGGAAEVAVDGDAATATFPLELYDGVGKDGNEGRAIWVLQVQAELEKRDGQWWIIRSSHETIAGEAPKLPGK